MIRCCLFVGLFALACGPSGPKVPVGTCPGKTVDTFAPGLTKTSGDLTISLLDILPDPPGEGFNDWVLKIEDTTGERTDLSPSLQAYMPDHGHGPSAVIGTYDTDGYHADGIDLFMPGYWETTVTVDSDEVVFAFCVE